MFKRREAGPALETLVGPTVKIGGDVEFSGGLHLDGRVAGNVRGVAGSDSHLSVSASGVIDGSVEVSRLELDGAVRGDILVTGRVVFGSNARVEGNVGYGAIEMASGARIIGRLTRLAGPVPGEPVESP